MRTHEQFRRLLILIVMPLKDCVQFIAEHGKVVKIRVSYEERALVFLRAENFSEAQGSWQNLYLLKVPYRVDKLSVCDQVILFKIVIAIASMRRIYACGIVSLSCGLILLLLRFRVLMKVLILNFSDDAVEVTFGLFVGNHIVQDVALEIDTSALLREYTFNSLQHIENIVGHHASIFIIVT